MCKRILRNVEARLHSLVCEIFFIGCTSTTKVCHPSIISHYSFRLKIIIILYHFIQNWQSREYLTWVCAPTTWVIIFAYFNCYRIRQVLKSIELRRFSTLIGHFEGEIKKWTSLDILSFRYGQCMRCGRSRAYIEILHINLFA